MEASSSVFPRTGAGPGILGARTTHNDPAQTGESTHLYMTLPTFLTGILYCAFRGKGCSIKSGAALLWSPVL